MHSAIERQKSDEIMDELLNSAEVPVEQLAGSVDDTELYATEPSALQVQIFSLIDGSLQSTLPIATPFSQIVGLANGRFAGNVNGITVFDATTGNQLFNFAGSANEILNNEELIAQNLGVFHAQ